MANDRKRRRQTLGLKPKLEGMEARELMSVAGILAGNYSKAMAQAQTAFARAQERSGQGVSSAAIAAIPPAGPKGTPLSVSINYALGQLLANNNLVPTQHEVARETLIVKQQGEYIVGPPRFTSQSFQIAFKMAGGSNQSYHANMLMAIFMPKQPGAPITGVAAIMPKNIAETGSMLVLDLVGDPSSLDHGLPTHFTWTADSNSGGIYLAGGSQGTGYGTLDIHYMASGRLRQRATGGGAANVVIQGLVNVGGVFSDIQVPGAH